MEIKKFSALYELFRGYSKYFENGDEDVRWACDHLVETFSSCMKEENPLEAFIAQIEEDASYSSWMKR